MKGRLNGLTFNRDGTQNVTVTVTSDFSEEYEELKNKDISVDIKRFRNSRSLDANAMCWVLVGQIAEKMNLTRNEVYRKAILDSGVYTVSKIPADMMDQFCEDWESLGIGFQVERFPSQDPNWINGLFYKGSHMYDSKQMARLIDGLIREAEELGIPTLTDADAQKLISEWKPRKGA